MADEPTRQRATTGTLANEPTTS